MWSQSSLSQDTKLRNLVPRMGPWSLFLWQFPFLSQSPVSLSWWFQRLNLSLVFLPKPALYFSFLSGFYYSRPLSGCLSASARSVSADILCRPPILPHWDRGCAIQPATQHTPLHTDLSQVWTAMAKEVSPIVQGLTFLKETLGA